MRRVARARPVRAGGSSNNKPIYLARDGGNRRNGLFPQDSQWRRRRAQPTRPCRKGGPGIPYVGAVIQIYQDREAHEPWRHAIVDGAVSDGADLGAGLAVTAGVAGVIGSGLVVAVGAGVVLGGAAAVGVGDFMHNMVQENWSADWHQHGVLGGTVHGVADSFDKTRHDTAHYGDDILNFF